ncbi:MAG: GerAB/ArcD/ProY family transporter [Bacillota bacterium]
MTDRLSARQLMLVVAVMRASAMLVLLPVVMVGDARQDAWIASIVSTLLSCILALLASGLAARFPGKSLGHIGKVVLGPIGGWLVIGLFALSHYVLALARARTVSLLVISQFMPKTPGWAIAVPMLAVSVYGAIHGPDTVGRSAEPVFVLLTGILVLGTVLLYASRVGPVTSLKPILARGFMPILASSVSPVFLGAVGSSVVLSLGRYVKKASSLGRAAVYGLLISGLFLTVVVLQVLTTIGHQQAQQSLAPLLSLAGAISIEGVVERTDLLLLASWIVGVTFDVTILLLSSSIVIADALSIDYRKVAAALFLAGVVPVSHRVTDVFSMRMVHSLPVTGIWTLVVFLGAIGVVYIVALVRRIDGREK